MAAPSNSHEFLDLVRKSGVVESSKLDAWRSKLSVAALPDSNVLAGMLIRAGLLTFYQAEHLLLGHWDRFVIGPYTMLERLGAGRMGRVYLCQDSRMHRTIAVKVMRHTAAVRNDPTVCQRFLLEARCLACAHHENVVRAYEVGDTGNGPYIGMEFVDGVSLQQLADGKGPLDPVRAAHYIDKAALGLQHSYMRGIIHRDIEPGNILVNRNGTAKLIDFGLACLADGVGKPLGASKLVTDLLLGPDYVAPELALDREMDHRADIYSLGATFYFCLTGQPPIEDGTVEQKLRWHQNHRPEPIRTLRPEVPGALAAVIDRMLAKHPAERFPNAEAVADALSPWARASAAPLADHEMPRWSPAALAAIQRSR